MADAFKSILVASLTFAFLPERPTRSQGGTDDSNPLSSSGESPTNRARRVPPEGRQLSDGQLTQLWERPFDRPPPFGVDRHSFYPSIRARLLLRANLERQKSARLSRWDSRR